MSDYGTDERKRVFVSKKPLRERLTPDIRKKTDKHKQERWEDNFGAL